MEQGKKSKWIKAIQIGLVALVCLDIYTRFYAIRHHPQIPTPTVIVAKPKPLPITQYVTQTGSIVAYNTVDLVARVEGYLDKINFVDGTFVNKGQNLFVIEPEPYMAKLREAKATVAAQQAIHNYDKAEYARQQRMYKENATSLNNVEKWFAKSQESEAEMAKATANEDIAFINYSYTHVAAPFDGRIGRHLIDVGNLVGNGVATVLATLNQLDPIYIYFNLNELDFIKLRAAARENGANEKIIKQVPVQVNLQNETAYKYEGKLDFVNTGLDASTGTMEFRALLPNKKYALIPGLFAQIRVALGPSTQQLTIPDTAVLYDQIGSYVLLVDKQHRVVLQRVTLGEVEKGQRAVLKGLKPDDNVIISGLQNATPGHQVVPQYEQKQP
ncbi:MAG: efflux transporter periplasmic adaptor subunit [Legionella sp.]|nr:MAG: efflux transporter periplasmic adaptor subunit [Legionella sp.]